MRVTRKVATCPDGRSMEFVQIEVPREACEMVIDAALASIRENSPETEVILISCEITLHIDRLVPATTDTPA